MLKIFLCALALILGAGLQVFAAPPASEQNFSSLYFCGTKRLIESSTNLQGIARMPESEVLLNEIAGKISTAPFRMLTSKLASPATNQFAPELRSLFLEAIQNPLYCAADGSTAGVPEFLAAFQIPKERHAYWLNTLSNILQTWTAIPSIVVSNRNYVGWTLKKHITPNLIVCYESRDWVLFGWGDEAVKLQDSFLTTIAKGNVPWSHQPQGKLEAILDIEKLQKFLPPKMASLIPDGFAPKVHLLVETNMPTPRDPHMGIRVQEDFEFASELPITLDKWNLPTNLLRGDVAQFTAIRGIEPWLSTQGWVEDLHSPSIPNQSVVWAHNAPLFDFAFAFPVENPSNCLAEVQGPLVAEFNAVVPPSPVPGIAAPAMIYTNGAVVLTNFPFAAVHVEPLPATNGEFLAGGTFPFDYRSPNMWLPGMLKRLYSDANLGMLDWEATDRTVPKYSLLLSMYRLVKPQRVPDDAAAKWLVALVKYLGVSTTEITKTAENHLRLERTCSIGFTGLELNLLGYWIDSPQFPFAPQYSPLSTRFTLGARPGAAPTK